MKFPIYYNWSLFQGDIRWIAQHPQRNRQIWDVQLHEGRQNDSIDFQRLWTSKTFFLPGSIRESTGPNGLLNRPTTGGGGLLHRFVEIFELAV